MMRDLRMPGLRTARILLALVLAGVILLSSITTLRPSSMQCQTDAVGDFLHSFHGTLVDSSGCEVYLSGVNWFGFETSAFAPHGLDVRNWRDMLKQMAQSGFNTVRLPFSNQLFDATSKPQGIDYRLNPDLRGLQGLALMDKIIAGAGSLGLKVILDRHDTSADERPQLWYTDRVPQSRWLHDWVRLARHYRGNSTIIGADLANEPHGPATWGDGNPATDWRMAAERAGNAILAVNPDWLIIVEGIEQYHGDWYWWGGNLEGARRRRFDCRRRTSSCIRPTTTARGSMPAVVSGRQLPQTICLPSGATGRISEGRHRTGAVWRVRRPLLGQDPAGVWQRSLVAFLKDRAQLYVLGVESRLGRYRRHPQDDWTTVNENKLHVLGTYQWLLTGKVTGQHQWSIRGGGNALLSAYQFH